MFTANEALQSLLENRIQDLKYCVFFLFACTMKKLKVIKASKIKQEQ